MAKRSSKKLGQGDGINGILFEPESNWVAPTSADLERHHNIFAQAKRIGFDCETRDPNLTTSGPGSFRRDGYPVGYSLAAELGSGEIFAAYYPVAHLAGGNGSNVGDYIGLIKGVLENPTTEKVGCTTIYDIEWLDFVGINVKGRIHDIAHAEALLDEESETGYSLDAIAKRVLGVGKSEDLLRRAAVDFNCDGKKELWKLHAKYVGPYGEDDARRSLQSHVKQLSELEEHRLLGIYDIECELTPIVWQMRKLGVRVDEEKATLLSRGWQTKEDQISYRILSEYGIHLDPWSAQDIGKVCNRLNISYPTTEKGNPSFDQAFLDASNHPFLKSVRELRRYNSLRSRFIGGQILSNAINGRVHCQFNQLKGDENGVRGGRFSSSNPNLQQVPARDPELAHLIRALYIPEEGCDWAKLDYAQQEPRITVHYAYKCKLRGADAARQAYIDNPELDIYQYLADQAELKRKDAKTVYLGISYSEGKKKLAHDLNRSLEEADTIITNFDERSPYIRELSQKCMSQVEKLGYIRTVAGRLCHFDHWVPKPTWDDEQKRYIRDFGIPIRGREKAETHYPGKKLQRAHTHKALNRLIQGSAGDMTKLALIKNYREHKAIPHLTVHDELDYSAPNREYAAKLKYGMENCVSLTVPIIAELDYGRHWK
jgi:DNA polymerase I-like protein with 3'-5' exonuclease and polymerase domains